MKFLWKYLIAIMLVFSSASSYAITDVDLELGLVIDVSASVNSSEYNLQMQGYKAAFLNAGVQSAIQDLGDAGTGGIAVGVFFFASNAAVGYSWTQIGSAAEATTFANIIGSLVRPNLGCCTDIAAGMNMARNSIANNDFNGARKVMDVSGDGQQNETCGVGTTTLGCLTAERNAAQASGITVNGLPILTDVPSLATYYTNYVKTPDGFVNVASGFGSFATAVTEKIYREIKPVPEPASLMLMGIGLLGFGFARRKQN